jgi:hypothetical protein
LVRKADTASATSFDVIMVQEQTIMRGFLAKTRGLFHRNIWLVRHWRRCGKIARSWQALRGAWNDTV